MKLALAFVTALISSSALACPTLQGTWLCKNSDASSSTSTIQESPIPGGTLYKLTERSSGKVEEYYADGQSRPVSDNGLSGTLTATCTGVTNVIAKEHLASKDQSFIADINYKITVLNAANFLVSASVVMLQRGQPSQTQSSTSTCVRQ